MKTLLFPALLCLGLAAQTQAQGQAQVQTQSDSISGCAAIGKLRMYYEIHGKGFPLVLIHGGGSTIGTSFGNVLHTFAKTHQVIAVERPNGHGHCHPPSRTRAKTSNWLGILQT